MIRPLDIEDYNSLVSLWIASELEYRPNGRDSREDIRRQMAESPLSFIGYFINNKLVASVLVTHDGRKGWINRLAVHPDFRRSGIARKLIEYSEGTLIKQNIHIFAALIYEDNAASLSLFQSKGYELCKDIVYLRRKTDTKV